MSTTINTNISSLCLTADLPDEVEVESLTPQVTVSISVGDKEVFSSVYYVYGLKIYVRDIRSIVESAMLQNNLSIAKFVMTVKDYENFEYTPGDIWVVYSAMKSPVGSESFLQNSFLSTRRSALISQSCPFTLYSYASPNLEKSSFCDIYYSLSSAPGQLEKYTSKFATLKPSSPVIISSDASYSKFQQLLSAGGIRSAVIRRVAYHIGSRVFNVYFTPDTPSDTFQFRNVFDLWETACLFGASTIKTEVDRSEAVCGRKISYYDEQLKVHHEVETAPLTFSEAQHMTQLLISREITREVTPGVFAPVLITDISSEVSDNNTNPIRMKFTWTYADQTEYLL